MIARRHGPGQHPVNACRDMARHFSNAGFGDIR
jgi:hypothetical protein